MDTPIVFMRYFRPCVSDMRCEFVEKLTKLRNRIVAFFVISSQKSFASISWFPYSRYSCLSRQDR